MENFDFAQARTKWATSFKASQTEMNPEIAEHFLKLCMVEKHDPDRPLPEELLSQFMWRLMESRLTVKLSNAVKVLLQLLCETPGDMTMWCCALNTLVPKDRVFDIEAMSLMFPMGFPSRKQLDDLWAAQKIPVGNGNLVDYKPVEAAQEQKPMLVFEPRGMVLTPEKEEAAAINYTHMALSGLSLLGGAFANEPAALASIMSGERDQELLCAIAGRMYFPISAEDLQRPEVVTRFNLLKANLKLRVSLIGRKAVEAAERQSAQEAAERQRQLHSQNAAGTTEQIAELLGVSKSAVRRMRADGTLDDQIKAAMMEKEPVE